MYYFMLVLSALLIGVAIYKKNPIVVSSEYREKPYSWFSICALSITSCLASMFILNPHIEMQSIPTDPVLNVYEHKANGLTMLWFLSEFYLFLVFAFFTLFKEVRNKYFIFFTDIISIAGICGSFSGILRYLDKLDYSSVSICAIAGVLILLSVFFSKKNSALTWLGNTNYLLIIGLGAYLAIGTDFNACLKSLGEIVSSKTLSVIGHSDESELIAEYTGWAMAWSWVLGRFMCYVCQGKRVLNSMLVMNICYFLTCLVWFTINENADLEHLTGTEKNVILVIALISFLTSLNAMMKTIRMKNAFNHSVLIGYVTLIIMLLGVYFGYIHAMLFPFWCFVVSVIGLLVFKIWRK